MATEHNSIQTQNECDRLSSASLEACYVDSLLAVIEDIFGDLDRICDHVPAAAELVRPKARIGLNITYMAQDKLGAIKALADGVEKSLTLAERLATTQPSGRA